MNFSSTILSGLMSILVISLVMWAVIIVAFVALVGAK